MAVITSMHASMAASLYNSPCLQIGGVIGCKEAAGLAFEGVAQSGRLAAAEGLPGLQHRLRPFQHLRSQKCQL